jgi:predicted membrane-bound spermidine synthase
MWRAWALALTLLTGCSGLVYEVAWQKYLAILLGSHSEATAAVLAIFLAGLSVGYALFGALSRRFLRSAEARGKPPRLLLAYGLIEMGIGAYAFLFPVLFAWVQDLSTRIPHGGAGAGFALDVGLAALLIGPPTILMGATIPMLTQALARSLADATRFHAILYGTNTAGAFVGALAAGFLLIPSLGLARVMSLMGAINLGAGLIFVAMGPPGVPFREPAEAPARPERFAIYYAVALLSGFAMMAVQTVLVRLGALSFGASEFTFATVVGVFVLSIALGSLGVSLLGRIRAWYLVANQWLLAALLFALYWPLEQSPYAAHLLRTLFGARDADFYPYHLAGFLGILVVIGLPVALSGATLPLLFHHLGRKEGALGSVAGRIYAWNTLGSLLGALLGGYALLFWLDLHHVYRISLAALALAATLLTVGVLERSRWKTTATLLAPSLCLLLLIGPWDPRLLSSGLFRSRRAVPASYLGAEALLESEGRGGELVFYDDDPTTSVAVEEWRERGFLARSIITHGKSDGSTAEDYPTMALAALIPSLLAGDVRKAFVIGYGTGITAAEFAALESTEEVVVAEISPSVVRAAAWFDFSNGGASANPKIRIVRSDAYRALLRGSGGYDVIASEPSHPWVSGVEMLFSQEFLEAARSRLAPGGVFVQWYHLYETDAASIELVLRTYASVFEQVSVWYGLGSDLLLMGFNGTPGLLDLDLLAQRAARPDFARALRRSGVESFPALLVHELLPLGVVHAAALEGPVHGLTHPRLGHTAGRAFFRGRTGELPFTGVGDAARVGERNSLLRRYLDRFEGDVPDEVWGELVGEACSHRRDQCAALLADWQRARPWAPALRRLVNDGLQAEDGIAGKVDPRILPHLGALLATRPGGESGDVTLGFAQRATELYARSYYHAVPFAPRALVDLWSRCRPLEACRPHLEQARAFLEER